MSAPATPIQALAAMRDITLARNVAIDRADDGTTSSELWATASRSWSRQAEGLLRAIVEEPPRDLEDATLLLLHLIEWRAEVADFDVGDSDIARCQEATDAALHSLVVYLSETVRPNAEWSDETRFSFDWSRRIVARRLPPPVPTKWEEAKAEYDECAKAADAATSGEEDAADDRKGDAEDRLMAVPAPDGEAFAVKFLIAHGGKRDTDCWDEMLEADAVRLTGGVL